MLTLGVIGWIIIGGLAGWIGSKIMKTDGQMGLVLNVVVGVIGGLLGRISVARLRGGRGRRRPAVLLPHLSVGGGHPAGDRQACLGAPSDPLAGQMRWSRRRQVPVTARGMKYR